GVVVVPLDPQHVAGGDQRQNRAVIVEWGLRLHQGGERAVLHVRQSGPDRVADVVVYPVKLPNRHRSPPGSTATPAPGTAPAVPGRGRSGASPSTTPPAPRPAAGTATPPATCCGCRPPGPPGRPARTRRCPRRRPTR